MIIKSSHICVCICTYKRPKSLERLLKKLQNQKTDELFTYSVIVVDNDYLQSAKDIVSELAKTYSISIKYDVEPEQNISLARNKAIQNAHGNFIAFIDDDEFPTYNWLINLYKICIKYKADGVFGPVKPHFEKEPPKWIIKGKLCERPTYETGTILQQWSTMGTGNVLLKNEIFNDRNNIFDSDFGRTGGGDVVFFKELIENGYTFVWCNEAPVHETVPPDRWKLSYFLSRALLGGKNSLKYHKKEKSYRPKVILIIKTIIAFLIYTLALPFLFLAGRHIFIKYLIRDFHHIGRLLALLGIEVVKKRNF